MKRADRRKLNRVMAEIAQNRPLARFHNRQQRNVFGLTVEQDAPRNAAMRLEYSGFYQVLGDLREVGRRCLQLPGGLTKRFWNARIFPTQVDEEPNRRD
jgi:hypothetical protein